MTLCKKTITDVTGRCTILVLRSCACFLRPCFFVDIVSLSAVCNVIGGEFSCILVLHYTRGPT